MKRIIGAGRQLRVVCVDLADMENTGGCATVMLLLAQSRFLLAGQAASPGEPRFPEQDRKGLALCDPLAPRRAFEKLHVAVN